MEFTLLLAIIVIIALWTLRKSIRVWATVGEKSSESTARKILVNIAKQDIKTAKKTKALIDDENAVLSTSQMDDFLFDGKKPKGDS
jgi:hypothetical protein